MTLGYIYMYEYINMYVCEVFPTHCHLTLLGSSGTFRDLLEVALPEIFNEGL